MSSQPVDTLEIPDRVRGVVAAAQDRKAQDILVLHLGTVTDFTDYFLICSGTNERQARSLSPRLAAACPVCTRPNDI